MSPSIREMDLSGIYRNQVFHSNDVEQSHNYLRTALAEHRIYCGPGKVDSALYSASSRRLKMFILRYGPEVEVEPEPFDGFALVQMPVRGHAEIDIDDEHIRIGAGQAAVIPEGKNVRLRWSRDCEQLMVRIPLDLVGEAATRNNWCGRSAGNSLLGSTTVLKDNISAQWSGLLQSLMELVLPRSQGENLGANSAWLDHVELSLAYFLLLQQAHDESVRGKGASGTVGSQSFGLLADAGIDLEPALAAAERYMKSRLCAPIALEDLARAAGVSSRTLHMQCKRRYGVSPMVWLRNVRLEATRQKLEANSACHVTDAAMEFGFGNLGRFSAYYRERFGELPRQTVSSTRQTR